MWFLVKHCAEQPNACTRYLKNDLEVILQHTVKNLELSMKIYSINGWDPDCYMWFKDSSREGQLYICR